MHGPDRILKVLISHWGTNLTALLTLNITFIYSPDEYGITISEIALACTQMHDEFSEARINDTLSSLSSADSVAFIARMRLWLSRNPSAMRQTVSTGQ